MRIFRYFFLFLRAKTNLGLCEAITRPREPLKMFNHQKKIYCPEEALKKISGQKIKNPDRIEILKGVRAARKSTGPILIFGPGVRTSGWKSVGQPGCCVLGKFQADFGEKLVRLLAGIGMPQKL